MKNNGIIVAIVIFVLIIVGMFVFAYLKNAELTEAPTTQVVETPRPGPYDSITLITAKHFFIDGKHTLVGEIPMPTACDLLNWDTSVAESMPEEVTVNFDAINNSTDCAPQVTNQRFKVEFTASDKASIKATLEGREVQLNLIPAGQGETPDDYELFIKG